MDELSDTGAFIKCVGNVLAERILQLNILFKKMTSSGERTDDRNQKR